MARATLALLLTLAAAACRDAPAASPPRVAPRCAYAAACPAMTPARSLDDSPEWRAIAPRLDAPTVDDLLEIELQVAHAADPTLAEALDGAASGRPLALDLTAPGARWFYAGLWEGRTPPAVPGGQPPLTVVPVVPDAPPEVPGHHHHRH